VSTNCGVKLINPGLGGVDATSYAYLTLLDLVEVANGPGKCSLSYRRLTLDQGASERSVGAALRKIAYSVL
jgi:hypothetical protein